MLLTCTAVDAEHPKFKQVAALIKESKEATRANLRQLASDKM